MVPVVAVAHGLRVVGVREPHVGAALVGAVAAAVELGEQGAVAVALEGGTGHEKVFKIKVIRVTVLHYYFGWPLKQREYASGQSK